MILTFQLFWTYFSLVTLAFALQCLPSIARVWSCCCLSFHWLSHKPKRGCHFSLYSLWLLLSWSEIVFMNWEMMSSYLPTGYFSWCYWILQEGQVETGESFRSSLIHLNGFHLLLAAIAHRNYFFQSIKQNKSSAPFENFESLQSYDIKVCFLITLYAGALQLY